MRLFDPTFSKNRLLINWRPKINYECHISNQAPLQRSGERRPPFSLRLWASPRCQVVSWITRISPGFGRFDTFMWQDIYQHNRNKSPFINWIEDTSFEHRLSGRSRWSVNPRLISGWSWFYFLVVSIVRWWAVIEERRKRWLLVGLKIINLSDEPITISQTLPTIQQHNTPHHDWLQQHNPNPWLTTTT